MPSSTGCGSPRAAYGASDLTSDFTIGRNQVVVADVNSHDWS